MTFANRYLVAIVGLATLAIPVGSAEANGYPPFGAWAYGSGYTPHAIHRHWPHRTVYRSWGGYGNIGYAATTRVRYGWHAPLHHHHLRHHVYRPYVTPTVVTYPFLSSYCAYRPVIAYPVVTYPVISYPVIVPTYVWPVCAAPSTSQPSTSYSLSYSLASRSDMPQDTPLKPGALLTSTRPTAKSNTVNTVRLAATSTLDDESFLPENSVQVTADVPGELMELADTMMRLGAYSEAATAYARLSVRYGSSQPLLLRRYVAQVLSGDLNQAEVLINLADASQQILDGSELPTGSLEGFLGSPVVIDAATERLAARALEQADDAIPLQSVATWLQLKGDRQRAEMFLARARQLKHSSSDTEELELSPPEPIGVVTID